MLHLKIITKFELLQWRGLGIQSHKHKDWEKIMENNTIDLSVF